MNITADKITSNFLERCTSVAKGGPRNSSSQFHSSFSSFPSSLLLSSLRIPSSKASLPLFYRYILLLYILRIGGSKKMGPHASTFCSRWP